MAESLSCYLIVRGECPAKIRLYPGDSRLVFLCDKCGAEQFLIGPRPEPESNRALEMLKEVETNK